MCNAPKAHLSTARGLTLDLHASLACGSMPARPHLLTSVITHSDHVFEGLLCFLVPGIAKFVIDLIQDVAQWTWPYHLSRRCYNDTVSCDVHKLAMMVKYDLESSSKGHYYGITSIWYQTSHTQSAIHKKVILGITWKNVIYLSTSWQHTAINNSFIIFIISHCPGL